MAYSLKYRLLFENCVLAVRVTKLGFCVCFGDLRLTNEIFRNKGLTHSEVESSEDLTSPFELAKPLF